LPQCVNRRVFQQPDFIRCISATLRSEILHGLPCWQIVYTTEFAYGYVLQLQHHFDHVMRGQGAV
jgi:hypothetical protein